MDDQLLAVDSEVQAGPRRVVEQRPHAQGKQEVALAVEEVVLQGGESAAWPSALSRP